MIVGWAFAVAAVQRFCFVPSCKEGTPSGLVKGRLAFLGNLGVEALEIELRGLSGCGKGVGMLYT